jgi:purine-binding chemotaxis protein CheW
LIRSPATLSVTLTSTATTESNEALFLLFRIDGRFHACSVSAVREVIPLRGVVRLPGSPPCVQGLVNLRGTVVTVLDLGRWLDAERPLLAAGSIIMVEHGGRLAGVAVDEVREVRSLGFEPLEDVDPERAPVLKGLGRIGDTVVIHVDIHALIKLVLD